MTKIRNLYSLFLLIAFSSIGYAQPVFITSESNVDQTVNQIFNLYEAQIDLSYDHVFNFVTNLVEGSDPDACENPYPKIKSLTQGFIDFYWDSIPNAQYYEAAFLNLNTAEEDFTETPGPGINFSGLKGLILFGFNTICADNMKSGTGIIIVDADILFPVPPEENNCDCELTHSIPIYNGSSPAQQAFSIPWPSSSQCGNSKYQIRVDGDLDLGSPSETSYSSEISFIHGKESTPNVIYLLSKCDKNALSSLAPLRAGGLDYTPTALPYYNASFTHANLILTIPASNLHVDNMYVDVCRCKKKGKGKSRDGEIDNAFESISLSPNPSSDRVQISLGLENTTAIHIEVYDLLGKRITTLTRKNQLASGQHFIDVDVQSWPIGMYSFHISSATQNKVLFFSKN